MKRAVIGFPRITSFTAFSGGSWTTAYPLANLGAWPLSRVARSSDAATTSTIIIAAAAAAVDIGMLALCGHNLSAAATIRTQLYSDLGTTSVLDDTDDVFPAAFADEDISDGNWHLIKLLDSTLSVRQIKLSITDTGNAAGYVQAGYLEVSQAHELAANPDFGGQYGFRLRSLGTAARGGAIYFERRAKPRQFTGTITFDSRDEALQHHWERYRQLDLSDPFLWLFDPDDTDNRPRTSFLARNLDPQGLFTMAALDRDTVPIALEEVIG